MDQGEVIDLSDAIERLSLFEERAAVRFEGLSAFLDSESPSLTVRGELHPVDGSELDEDVEVVVAAYDRRGRIIGIGTELFDVENFFGFATFEVYLSLPRGDVARVRVHPRRG
jgi:hypothetical protein